MKIVILSFLLFTGLVLNAQTVEGETELCGFILGQTRKAVHAQLGRPIERYKTNEGWIYEFNNIKPDTSVYALFKYPVWDTLSIYAIQLTGSSYDNMHPFKGLKLGASRADVEKALGPYDQTEPVENSKVVVQYYKHKNYSVEIDERGTLYGIEIFGSITEKKPTAAVPSFEGFKNAVLSKNTDSLLLHLMPNVELYVNNKVVAFVGAAREEFKRNDSELARYLLGPENSVWHVFNTEKAEATAESRLYGKNKQHTTTVYKFYSSKVLTEIVYRPHAGRWKVYEIKFAY